MSGRGTEEPRSRVAGGSAYVTEVLRKIMREKSTMAAALIMLIAE
jgi:hypothetical protein